MPVRRRGAAGSTDGLSNTGSRHCDTRARELPVPRSHRASRPHPAAGGGRRARWSPGSGSLSDSAG